MIFLRNRIDDITRDLIRAYFPEVADFCTMALIFVAAFLVLFTFGGNQ